MNKELEERYLSVINDNVNVGKRSDGKEFLILIAGVIGFCLLAFIFADSIANIFIDNMSAKTQMKIEKAISFTSHVKSVNTKNSKKQVQLEKIRDRITRLDKRLQGKSNFPIIIVNQKEINAFIYPDGRICFTTGLLKEVKDEEVLTFIMAHELGHYAHRDHLKGISRDIITAAIMSVVSGGNNETRIAVDNISNLTGLKYSRRQEAAADKYANKIIYRLYGRNTGAVKFFKYLESKEKIPEFIYYFSTHPSTKDRLKMIQKTNY